MKTAKKKERRPTIPKHVVVAVWTSAGGRCEFKGCNDPLWRDLLTNTKANFAYIAHIISWTPTGLRGDKILSPKLAKEPLNLMLVCDVHHRMVDDSKKVEKYSVAVLTEYKTIHEERIETLTDIKEEMRTTMLIMQAPIGPHDDPINVDDARRAVVANGRYPAKDVLVINMEGLGPKDEEKSYWRDAKKKIKEQYRDRLRAARHFEKIDHISVFGFGPIPVLTHLGLEIGDSVEADVYNLSRDPKGWPFPNDGKRYKKIEVTHPKIKDLKSTDVCAIISVTSSVQRHHVNKAILPEYPVFELRFDKPNIDIIRSAEDIKEFVEHFHRLMELIHDMTPNAERIHVFSAVPVAIAIEMGRAQLPKRHATLVLYDYNKATSGMAKAMELGGAKKSRK